MNPTQTAARHALESLIQKYRAMSADDRLQMSEASVVRQFIDLLLRDVLLWPIEDTQRYKYELVTEAGRPDITLIPPSGGTVFIEAKKFGVIKESPVLDKNKLERVMGPQQMALSGMVVDRTKEEQQAINYAFRNGGTWAILTNFEKFRLFHARRDSLVLNIESPDGYLEGFDYLWKLAYPNIITGGLEELARMRPLPEVDEEYLKVINNWRQLLAQDLVRREAHNVWIRQPDGSLNLADLRSVVQRYIDRMVLVRYAEAHLILTPGSLERLHEIGLTNDYVGLDVILGTMFRGFDEIHNSALFAPSLVDRASFSNKVLTDLIGDLYKARYRAMPPDIIGNTYEQYLGKTLVLANGSVKTAENLETRKKQGSYYTPQVIVQYIVDSTLGRYLYATTNGKPDGEPLPDETPKTSRDILHLRVLDSACGSGGFLIYAYQVLAEFYRREMDRLQQAADTRIEELIAQGITDPNSLRIETLQYLHERDRISDYRRIILEVHLYGVDLDPQAAEIAVVNLMMQAMVGLYLLQSDDKRLPLLLNQNIKVGNSLIGTATPPLTDVSSPSSPAGRG
ncbi:MAG: N-6 DNA methylase, partial [Anaerolineae bacterium]|nr:N-6 DNA methylase [Anaerolineae bacterium]